MEMNIGGKEDSQFNYKLDVHPLEYTTEEKDLGSIIDNRLKFETHQKMLSQQTILWAQSGDHSLIWTNLPWTPYKEEDGHPRDGF